MRASDGYARKKKNYRRNLSGQQTNKQTNPKLVATGPMRNSHSGKTHMVVMQTGELKLKNDAEWEKKKNL